MTPGDAWMDPLIRRGEELERLIKSEGRASSADEQNELDSIKAHARSRIAHLAAYPLANTSQEESAQDLADEEARSAREREQFVGRIVAKAWEAIEPVVDAALAAAVAGALKGR